MAGSKFSLSFLGLGSSDPHGLSVTCLCTRAWQHVSAPAEHNRRMIGLLRKGCVIGFQRSHINESTRPSLSGFNLASADQARQSTLADGEERSSVTRREGDRF